jgi:hypothetical protein
MLGDVGDPKLVRGVGREHAFHLVFEHGRQAPSTTVTPLAMMDSPQPSQPHQTLDSAMTDPQASTQDQFRVDTANPVGSPRGGMQGADLIDQVRVGEVPGRRTTGTPLVASRRRNLQHPASHRDGEVAAELVDQPEPYFGSTFSFAK